MDGTESPRRCADISVREPNRARTAGRGRHAARQAARLAGRGPLALPLFPCVHLIAEGPGSAPELKLGIKSLGACPGDHGEQLGPDRAYRSLRPRPGPPVTGRPAGKLA